LEVIVKVGRFVSRLREVIDSKGVKYKYIYDNVGINKSTMSGLLNGRIPSYPIAYKIAKLLEVPMEEIWYEEENEDK
jgi:putative transcriptional regulator